MMPTPTRAPRLPQTAPPVSRLVVPLLLVLTAGVAHFLRLSAFGLYEDDYYYVGEPLGWDLRAAVDFVAEAFTNWPQGRPVGLALPRFLAFAVGSSLGLRGIYLLGFAVIAANTLLAHRLAARFLPPFPALAFALVFCLFPADTTRIFPTYALQMHVALLFSLLAADRLLARRHLAATAFFALVLLTYETPGVPLFLVPLLGSVGWTLAWKRWLPAWAAMASVVLSVVAIRSWMGERRIVEALSGDLPTLLGTVAAAPFVGFFASARLLMARPIDALFSLAPEEWLAVLACFCALAWVIARLVAGGGPGASSAAARAPGLPPLPEPDSAGMRGAAGWTLFVGILTWLAGYALSFTHWPPLATAGRPTSVHGAAALGAATTSGALAWILLLRARRRIARIALGVCVAGYFSLLLGFHLTVQRAFAESWSLQRDLWRQVVRLCPDLEEGMLIFLRTEGLPENSMALVSSWADPLVLELVFRFPPEWSSVPRAFALSREVVDSFSEANGIVRWRVPDATWKSHLAVLDRSKVVVLASEGGRLRRERGTVRINSVEIRSKRRTRLTVAAIPRGPLFELLLGSELP